MGGRYVHGAMLKYWDEQALGMHVGKFQISRHNGFVLDVGKQSLGAGRSKCM